MINKTKKITLLLASLNDGGIQNAAMHLIREFSRRDIQVTLVVVNAKGLLKKKIPEECTLIDLNCQQTRHAFFRLMRYLLSERPETVISSQTHLNVLVICIRTLIGMPRHLIVREHITFNNQITTDKKILERMRPWLIWLFYPLASKIIAVSKSSAESIHQFTGIRKEIRVIQNGVDIELIHQKAAISQNHPWLNNKDIKLIIGMGRLVHQKGFLILLEAFSKLKDPHNYRLIILGEGAEREKLGNLSRKLNIEDYVDFPGFVENPFTFLAKANLFVLPSRWEGFSNAVIEALACGIPVITTDCPGGPADILTGKTFAQIVPMDNPIIMARAIEKLLIIKHKKEVIREYAENFKIQNIVQQYMDLMSELE